jgi:hypothetical protein
MVGGEQSIRIEYSSQIAGLRVRLRTYQTRYGAVHSLKSTSVRVQFKMSHLFRVPPSRLSAGCINGKFQIPLLIWLQCTDNQEIAPKRYLPKAVL